MGMPVFDWPAHAANGFAWWLARLERELELFDLIRIDHFRGLVKFWQLPLDELDPTKGSWGEEPGGRSSTRFATTSAGFRSSSRISGTSRRT